MLQLSRDEKDAERVYIQHGYTLDSFFKSSGSDVAAGRYIFELSDDDPVRVAQNIVKIQVMPFTLPLPVARPYATNDGKTDTSRPVLTGNGAAPAAGYPTFSKQISMSIRETALGSTSLASGARVNFMLNATSVDGRLSLTAPDDTFIFAEPIRALSAITLEFGDPDRSLAFYPDVFTGISVTSAAVPTIVAGMYSPRVVLPSMDDLYAGDRVIISGFNYAHPTTPTSTAPGLNALMNSPTGHYIGENLLGEPLGYQPGFTLNVAPRIANCVVEGVISTGVTVYIPKRRFIIPLRLFSLYDDTAR